MPQSETHLSLLCVLDICADMFNYCTEHVREGRGKGHKRAHQITPPVRPFP